jgi:hypothetical protein
MDSCLVWHCHQCAPSAIPADRHHRWLGSVRPKRLFLKNLDLSGSSVSYDHSYRSDEVSARDRRWQRSHDYDSLAQ